MAFLRRLHGFVVKQRCMPWRLRVWLGKRHPRVLVFLQTGRTNINTAGYWDGRWQETGPGGARWCRYPRKFARIAELVPAGSAVLDLGCGVGLLLEELRDRRHCRGTGVDISQKAIDMVRAKGFDGLVAQLPDLPLPDNSFDVVIATELVEHLDRPDKTLREMARVARPGARLFLSTPDRNMGTEDELAHLHVFDPDRLRALLEPFAQNVAVETIQEEGFESRFLLAHGTVRKAPPAEARPA